MTYRFKRIHRQFKAGDIVPATYDAGTIKTMLEYQIIEPVEKFSVPTKNKLQHRVSRK